MESCPFRTLVRCGQYGPYWELVARVCRQGVLLGACLFTGLKLYQMMSLCTIYSYFLYVVSRFSYIAFSECRVGASAVEGAGVQIPGTRLQTRLIYSAFGARSARVRICFFFFFFFCCTLDSRYRYFATLKLKLWSVRKQLSNVLFSVISSVIDSHRIERSYKDQLRDIFIVCEFSFLFNRHTHLMLWYGWCSSDRRNEFLLILGVHPHG